MPFACTCISISITRINEQGREGRREASVARVVGRTGEQARHSMSGCESGDAIGIFTRYCLVQCAWFNLFRISLQGLSVLSRSQLASD